MSKDHQADLAEKLKKTKKLRLHPTAALVMLWSLPLYAKGTVPVPTPVREFVEMLDLSSGEELLRKFDAICDWYGEVILNRKHFIKSLVEKLLEESEVAGTMQIVVLAAGKSPLALELLIENPAIITRIFEVDLAGIEEKMQLYSKLAPKSSENLRGLTADIASEDLIDRLAEEGFDPEAPAIFLMEGISYYLSKNDLERIVSMFRSGGRNRFIVEYLVPCSEVKSARREIPKGIFSLIRKEALTDGMTCYTELELSRIFQRSGGREISCTDMSEMERLRLGKNRHFRDRGDGWIECFLGEV
ncbi:MAG TPA: class I SAM-dependent methyltransferase [Methanothrix sp.]|nr:class I SAM-dependent methyltransferase [Methanothrix sp.]HPJ83949.1 class I SAM-dependent methyltransferase [Methanothrix sp.]HPR67281.1 class I SAM-dependent methyltransferase [Methanothrix sp.]